MVDDDREAAAGRVRGLTGWQNAKVADPADDFAALVTLASPAAFDSVLEAYAHARVDRPDKNLERRARLAGELMLVSDLLTAVGFADQSGDQRGVEVCAARLRRLDADIFDHDPDDEPVVPTAPAVLGIPVVEPDHSEETAQLIMGIGAVGPSTMADYSEQASSDDKKPAEVEAPDGSPNH